MPIRISRLFAVSITLFLSFFAFSQDWKFPVTSRVERNEKALEGATITVYKNGKQESQITTGADGKFRVELLPNGNYKIEITKAGMIKKYFTFNTNGVPPDDAKDGFKGFDIKAVELFDPPSDCDVSFLNQPLIKVAYDPATKNFEYDKAYSDQVLDQLGNVAECIEQEKIKSKKFDKVMQDGINAMNKRDYASAVSRFTEATQLKPKNEEAKAKLAEAKNMLENGQKLENDFAAAMKAGNDAMKAENYTLAISSFETAKGLKPSDPAPPQKIEECKKLMANAEKNKEFNDILAQGQAAITAKDYNKALELYTKAKGLKPEHPEPPKKLDELKKLMEGAAKDKNFDDAMKAGDAAATAKEYQKAIGEYTKAKGIKPESPEPQKKIDEMNKLLGEAANAAKYDAAMKKGTDAMAAKKWAEGITAFNEALSFKKDDAAAKAKIDECNAKLNEEKSAKELEEKFAAAMKKGTEAMAGKKWDEAIAGFTEALGIKKDDATAKAKKAEAEAEKAKEAGQKELEAKYAAAMKKGEDAMTAKKWADAVTAFNEALVLKKDDAAAKAKLADAQAKLDADKKSAEEQAKYEAAMKKGEGAMTAKKWADAIAAFNEALTHKKDDATAKTKIDECNTKLNEEKGAAELLAKYTEAMKKGADAMTAKKYADAVTAFNEALSFKKDDATAKAKLAEAEAKLKADKDAAELEQKYKDVMAKGEADLTAKKWSDAITSFTEALNIKKADPAATAKKAQAEAELKKEMGAAEMEKKYADAMKKGDDAAGGSKWQDAVNAYKEALTYKKDDASAKQKLTEAEAKLKAELDGKAADAKFAAAMKKGDDAAAAAKWAGAVAGYTEALGIKADDATAKQKLTDAQAKLDEENKGKEATAKYAAAMKKGTDAMTAKKWSDAIAAFNEALTHKAEDATAKAKIAEAEAKLKEEMGAKEMLAKYEEAMKKGNDAMTAKTWQDAVNAYSEALTYKKDDATALKQKAAAEAEIKKAGLAAEAEKKYAEAMKKGEDAMVGSKWQDAVNAYKEALTFKKEDATAKAKLAEADAKLKAELGDKALAEKYAAAIKKGDDAVAGSKWAGAVAAYTEALSYKKDDADATKKLADAQAKLDEENKGKEAAAKYAAAMKKGTDAMTAKKWSDAITAFNEALGHKADDATAKAKIAEAEAKMKEDMGAKEMLAKYTEAMKIGNDSIAAKNWNGAIAKFNEALSFKKDDATALKQKAAAEAELKKLAGAAENEKKYAEAMKKGGDAMGASNWQDAVNAYKEALTFKKEDADAKAKLAEADAKLKALLGDKALAEKYAAAMKKGDDAVAGSKWVGAVTAYKEALSYKKDDADATKKLADAQAKLDEENKGKEGLAKYTAAMKKGTDAMALKKWSDAVNAFNEALTHKAEDPTAKTKLAEAEAKMKEALGEKELNEKFAAALKAGDDAKMTKDYAAAIEQYKMAASLKPAAKEPPLKIAEVEKLIANANAGEEAFNKLLTDGKTAFDAKEWQKAYDNYKKASNIKPEHPEPPKYLPEIEKNLAETKLKAEAKKELEKDFLKAMTEGKALYDKKDWEKALEKYILAKNLGKDLGRETEPQPKIDEIEGIIEKDKGAAKSAAELDAKFAAVLKEGDDAKAAKEYEKALEKYTEAKELKPKAPEPPARIAELNKIIAKEKADKLLEQQYEAAMKEGDDAEGKELWDAAIAGYKKALKLRPGDADATKKLAEAEAAKKDKDLAAQVAAKERELEEKFKKELTEAKAAFTVNDYKKSLIHYTNANNIKKDEPEPPVKIEELKAIIKKMEEEEKLKGDKAKLDAEYTKAMDDGNKAVLEQRYEQALERFKHAQTLKPNEKEPPLEIAEVEDLIRKKKDADAAAASAAENEAKYKEAIKLGMEGIVKKDWAGAKTKYTDALKYKPKDPEATQKLDFINKKLAEDKGKTSEADYKAAIDRGNNFYKQKKWKESLDAFKEALGYKPTDQYAKDKVTELEKLVKPENVTTTTTKTRNPLLDKYPQGTTEESVNEKGVHITRVIIISGEEARLYEKKYFSWGATQFYRDGVQITQSVYDSEIRGK